MSIAILDGSRISRVGDLYRVEIMTDGLSEPPAIIVGSARALFTLASDLNARLLHDEVFDRRARASNVFQFPAREPPPEQPKRPRRGRGSGKAKSTGETA